MEENEKAFLEWNELRQLINTEVPGRPIYWVIIGDLSASLALSSWLIINNWIKG
jgi:hypothetical protein